MLFASLLLLGLSTCDAFGMTTPPKANALASMQRRALHVTIFMSEDAAPEPEAAPAAAAYKPTDTEIANEMRDMPRLKGQAAYESPEDKRARAIQRIMDKYDRESAGLDPQRPLALSPRLAFSPLPPLPAADPDLAGIDTILRSRGDCEEGRRGQGQGGGGGGQEGGGRRRS